jgi:hypothetical protein
MRTVILIA